MATAIVAMPELRAATEEGTKESAAAPDDWSAVPDLISRIAVPVFRPQDFEITQFGAKGNGKDDDLPALRAAIAACAAAGGGRVLVPPGTYLLNGPVHLASGINLHLAAGATLRFSGVPAHFLPAVLTRWEGTLLHNYSPMIYARGATNIAITGKGVIDGNGNGTFAGWLQRQAEDQKRLRQMGDAGTPLAERRFGEGHWLRPSLVQPFECERVLIEGVTLRDSPFWVVHPVLCRDVTIRGITVTSSRINNDGCDPDSCERVLIDNCVFRTGDDAIALKSGRDADGRNLQRPTQDIVIRCCDISSHNGIAIGSEMSGGVRRVFVEDCHVRKASGTSSAAGAAIFLKANRDRGAFIEKIRVRRVKIDLARGAAVRLESSYNHGYRGTDHPSRFSDVVIEDVTCAMAEKFAIYASGFPDLPLRDVTVKRLTVERAATPLSLKHTANFQLIDVRVNGDLCSLPAESKAAPK